VACPGFRTRSEESPEPRESRLEVLVSGWIGAEAKPGTPRVARGLPARGDALSRDVRGSYDPARLVLLVLDMLGTVFLPSTGEDSNTEEKDVEGERRY
jgi:hypothetical protein